MKLVESLYLQFPHGIECPQSLHLDADYTRIALEVSQWFKENDLIFQRDWIRCSKSARSTSGERIYIDAYLFRHRDRMLQFKLRFAGM